MYRFALVNALSLCLLALAKGDKDSTHKPCRAACSVATFEPLLPKGAVIEAVAIVPEGGSYGEGAKDIAYPTNPTGLPALCALTVRITSSPTSSFRFGLFLPKAWNSKFLAVGNGGFAGGINWLDMAPGPHYGFATVSTDTGHNATTTDVTWALNKPEERTDWGWRALHETVGLGKKLTAAYYRTPIKYSYYSGCSTGGRQGLKEVQISPDSFDGALVGAPAWYTRRLNVFVTKMGLYNLPVDDPKHIPINLFGVLGAEVNRQCDSDDGVQDGIISAPEVCKFDFNKILCGNPGVDPTACLTAPQIQTAKNVYGDYYSATGELLYTGLDYSSEDQWYILLSGTEPSPFGVGYTRYFVFDDPNWDWRTYNDSVLYYSDAKDAGNATAAEYDISDFKARGGKIIMYHGMADGLVPTRGTKWYYNNTLDVMGGLGNVQDFFRFFLVPGMQHCFSTTVDAPWNFGGAFQAGLLGTNTWSVPGFRDSRHDALLSLVDWVEKGDAPDSIIATTWTNPINASSGVLAQRPICPWPEKAVYDGSGNVSDASNWLCE